MTVNLAQNKPIYYPSSDGKPMAENTIQYDWLTTIKSGLEELTQNENTFVAGDLLWYPVEGNNRIRVAPDVMAAVGRPKGPRSSYLQWREDNIPPQTVIEISSPGNRRDEMARKLSFYEQYGVQEYLIYYPHKNSLQIYQRKGGKLLEIEPTPKRWTSQYLGFQLVHTADTLKIYHPDGRPFKTFLELVKEKEEAEKKQQQAEAKQRQAEAERQQAEAKQQAIAKQNELLLQKLKDLGIDPNEVLQNKT